MDWRPIETAPKDGSYILIVYRPFNKHDYPRAIEIVTSRRGGLFDDAGNEYDYATHWMPLPAPPIEMK